MLNTENIQDYGTNNIVEIGSGFNPNKVKINIYGNNNKICLKDTSKNTQGMLQIDVNAESSNITIDRDLFVGALGLKIVCGNRAFKPVNNSSINIGSNFSVGGGQIIIYNSHAHINIGRDCMLAWGIMIYNTDAHPIYDATSNMLINKVGTLSIGDNCWLGADVKILKNVSIANGTIVGYGSIVSKSFNKQNICICGNPAKIVKENVIWKRYDEKYIDNEINNGN